MRADAARNRALVLEAAEKVFSARGVGVPVDDVAEAAGVGVGTLYRHFPTKEALFEAIVVARLEDLVRAANEAAARPDAGEAFFGFLRRFWGQAAAKKDLFDALMVAGIDVKSECAGLFTELEGGIGRLLDRAKAAGAARPDVTATDVIGLVVGACHAASHSGLDGAGDRMITVVCDGLRA